MPWGDSPRCEFTPWCPVSLVKRGLQALGVQAPGVRPPISDPGVADYVGYLPLAPDLVAEIVSLGDRPSEVESKAKAWLDAGVPVVLVVDPQMSIIREYGSTSCARVHSGGFVDLNDVLPGFQLDVAELFS